MPVHYGLGPIELANKSFISEARILTNVKMSSRRAGAVAMAVGTVAASSADAQDAMQKRQAKTADALNTGKFEKCFGLRSRVRTTAPQAPAQTAPARARPIIRAIPSGSSSRGPARPLRRRMARAASRRRLEARRGLGARVKGRSPPLTGGAPGRSFSIPVVARPLPEGSRNGRVNFGRAGARSVVRAEQ